MITELKLIPSTEIPTAGTDSKTMQQIREIIPQITENMCVEVFCDEKVQSLNCFYSVIKEISNGKLKMVCRKDRCFITTVK